jgi:hypothetical protein
MVCNRFTYASNIFRIGMLSSAVLLLVSRHTHLLQNDGVDLQSQHCSAREIKMYGVPIGLLLISSFRCQHFHIIGVLAAVGSFAYGEKAILEASLSIGVAEKTQRQDSLIRLSWILALFSVSFVAMHRATENICKSDPILESTMLEQLLCACYHWVSRFELLLGMQVLTSYMLLTSKAPNILGSSFYVAAQCHVPFAASLASIVAVMQQEHEMTTMSFMIVAFVVCMYAWSPRITQQPLWDYVSEWASSSAGSLRKRLPLPDEQAPILVREPPSGTAAPFRAASRVVTQAQQQVQGDPPAPGGRLLPPPPAGDPQAV